jgi:hypothetical protein
MAKTLLEEALADVKMLRESAVENAKSVLLEAISPKIKEFVESQLGEAGNFADEDAKDPSAVGGMAPSGADGVHEAEKHGEPEHGDEHADLELMKQLGLIDSEQEHEAEHGEHGEDHLHLHGDVDGKEFELDETEHTPGCPKCEEESKMKEAAHYETHAGKGDGNQKEPKESLDEVVEITNEDLKAALSEVLGDLKEATVKKGFGPAEDATIKNAGGAQSGGLLPEKPGEHFWNDEEGVDFKDWTVKEAKQAFAQLKSRNSSLVKENADYKKAYTILREKLQEVNLFNNKLLYTQKLLGSKELNNKQRLGIIEAFDRAENIREVELVYRSLSESFKIAGVVSESKQERASVAKSSRLSTPSSTLLKEAVLNEDKAAKGPVDFATRMQELAGLKELE